MAEDDRNGAPDPGNIMKIMISTDSHLGYEERDPVRGMDSFAAFEEVLLLAKQNQADLVLLGGDLFHESKPSRACLYRTMAILRKHCLGDDPIRVKILSEQSTHFPARFGWANYDDGNFNVGLSVFSIHGNHDDPTRDGGGGTGQVGGLELCSLDLLHCAGLVNYFGQAKEVDEVAVCPVLLQKGQTKVAMYGLGNQRDERLARAWKEQRVTFKAVPPDLGGNVLSKEMNDGEDKPKGWFNIFVLHQNRVRRAAKNYIREEMIPEWMDLIVWGHEHESKDLEDGLVGTYYIIQPGSTVATSLVAGESTKKHCCFLQVHKDTFKFERIPLGQVRKFGYEEMNLAEEELDKDDPKVEDSLVQVLKNRVEAMLSKLEETEKEEPQPPPMRGQEFVMLEPKQALIRLVVEHTGFGAVSNSRFGQNFLGRVANAGDILLFRKKKATGGGVAGATRRAAHDLGLTAPIAPDTMDEIRVENLVRDLLEKADSKLSLLSEAQITIALEDFVERQDNSSIPDTVSEALVNVQKRFRAEQRIDSEAVVNEELQLHAAAEVGRQEMEIARKKTRPVKARADEDDSDGAGPSRQKKPRAAPKPKKAPAAKGKAAKAKAVLSEDEDGDSMDDFGSDDGGASGKKAGKGKATAAKKTKAPAKRKRTVASDSDEDGGGGANPTSAAGKRAVAKKSYKVESSSDVEEVSDMDNGNAPDELDSDSPAPPPKKARAAAAKPPARGREKKAAAAPTRASQFDPAPAPAGTRKLPFGGSAQSKKKAASTPRDEESMKSVASNW